MRTWIKPMPKNNNMTALRRIGNKNKIADTIIEHFPKNFDTLISMFYGTGSLEHRFLGKIKHIIANDLDNNVYNFYDVLINHFDELYDAVEMCPYHQTVFKEFKTQPIPQDKIKKALRLLVLSNFSFLGNQDTIRLESSCYAKKILLQNLKTNYKALVSNQKTTVQFMNVDFQNVIKSISIKHPDRTFVYADPPYLSTDHRIYDTPEWTTESIDVLFDVLVKSGLNFAISEFNHPYIIKKAQEHNLNVIEICERQSLKNRSTEILITNYKPSKATQLSLFKKEE